MGDWIFGYLVISFLWMTLRCVIDCALTKVIAFGDQLRAMITSVVYPASMMVLFVCNLRYLLVTPFQKAWMKCLPIVVLCMTYHVMTQNNASLFRNGIIPKVEEASCCAWQCCPNMASNASFGLNGLILASMASFGLQFGLNGLIPTSIVSFGLQGPVWPQQPHPDLHRLIWASKASFGLIPSSMASFGLQGPVWPHPGLIWPPRPRLASSQPLWPRLASKALFGLRGLHGLIWASTASFSLNDLIPASMASFGLQIPVWPQWPHPVLHDLVWASTASFWPPQPHHGIISSLQHPNLVRLYGCCIEGKQLLLVNGYMENNSLANALFGPMDGWLKLDWSARGQSGLYGCAKPFIANGYPCDFDFGNGSSSHFGRKLSNRSLHCQLLSSPFPKPFLQLDDRPQSFVYRHGLASLSSRTKRGPISAEAGKQSWDFGRFVKTLYFFNGPPSPAKFFEFLIEKLSNPSPSKPVKAMDTSGIVLVAGATGGVGRRVVDILRKKGLPVRVLVRNEEKARRMLGPDIDLIVGDITKESTLVPEYFKGVRKVINAVSVIVGPKEGDTPDRAKYSQPYTSKRYKEKGDSPEMVEYIGMKNLINAVKGSVGLQNGKLLFGFEGNNSRELTWGALDDVVMGGVSESSFQIDRRGSEIGGPTGVFKGVVSTANNGGFTSIRTKFQRIFLHMMVWSFALKDDGCRYKLIIHTSLDGTLSVIQASFDTVAGQWQSIRLPFSSLRPIFRARTVSDAPPFDPTDVVSLQPCRHDSICHYCLFSASWFSTLILDDVSKSLQLMFSKFEFDGKLNPTYVEGAFHLPLSSIQTYIKYPICPRFVHTRPDRPGLDLSKQPPAVCLNKELGYILIFKLKVEDLVRESGIPYAIIRPCALTEEPAGADLIFEQGDNIMVRYQGKRLLISAVATLDSTSACDKTFEHIDRRASFT
uniref:NADH:ubiquinone oxidoreductase intermediate-associated protein 30 domain-containing protein n=1 Tax=Fagus sylvatica TaxID=28930 RepID=A0A2N9IJG7_FAGSY